MQTIKTIRQEKKDAPAVSTPLETERHPLFLQKIFERIVTWYFFSRTPNSERVFSNDLPLKQTNPPSVPTDEDA